MDEVSVRIGRVGRRVVRGSVRGARTRRHTATRSSRVQIRSRRCVFHAILVVAPLVPRRRTRFYRIPTPLVGLYPRTMMSTTPDAPLNDVPMSSEAAPFASDAKKAAPGTQKRLTFSAEVSQKQGDKENLDNLAASLSQTSFRSASSRLVSPGTFLRERGPVTYGEAPPTPGTALGTPAAPEPPMSRWTPARGRNSSASSGDDEDDDDDDDEGGGGASGDDDDDDGSVDAATTPRAGGEASLSRKSVKLFRRQQAAIDAAADAAPPVIAIVKSAPEQLTPAAPRYVTSYRETPLTGESRESDWSPRSRSERGGGSDDEDDVRLL